MNRHPIQRTVSAFLSLVSVLGCLFIFGVAYADQVIVGNLDTGTQGVIDAIQSPTGIPALYKGESFYLASNAVINSFTINAFGSFGPMQAHAYLYFWDVGNSTLTLVGQSSDFQESGVVTIPFVDPVVADPGYYVLSFRGTNQYYTAYLMGTTTNMFSGGCLTQNFLATSTSVLCFDNSHGGYDMYFSLNGSYMTTSQITRINSPLDNSSNTNTTIVFSYDYLNASPPMIVKGFELQDLTNGQTINVSGAEDSIYTSGNGSYNYSMGLITSHLYRWRAYLGDGNSKYYSSWMTFGVGNGNIIGSTSSPPIFGTFASGISGLIANITDQNNATTSSETAISAFGNIIDHLGRKVPWGYAYDIYLIWNHSATTTGGFGDLAIDYGSMGIATNTKSWLPQRVTFFGTSTVTHYLNGGILALFNALATAAVSIIWVMYAYRRATGLFKPI